ncbi:TetR/AcrR family transcriptional regulator [Allostreptomyces psammosilenae]|uniref:AcrR family transcriptional regulator n=1 Tax=Allostreptomyces psammosilenae TaxID=1892865 RepID=A0A853ACI6_9ACTN|nr:TetR family transcriptional regulator [Allostreptomyces psammosilenae]NYI08261.1 AcrR family transcriptional regulator [Allostreptomyces psammosilenae]
MNKNAAATRASLLAAARSEFAAYGIAGARVDRIAQKAGANKERIYGHFGSKELLFDAVVADALDELSAAVTLDTRSDPAEYVGQIYDFHRNHPDLLRLLMFETLHYREGKLANERERHLRYQAKIDSLAEAIDRPDSREVARLLLTLIGLASWPTAMPQLARLILGPETDPEEDSEAMRSFLVRFVEAAIPSVTEPVNTSAAAES